MSILSGRSTEVAAAHRQGYAGDIGSFVAGQEQDRADLLIEAGVAFHQTAVEGLVDDLLVPDLLVRALRGIVARNPPRRCFSAARCGGIDANSALGILECQAGRECIHAPLGRAVRYAVDAAGSD